MPSTTVEIRGKDRTKTAFSSVSASLKTMRGAIGSLQGAVVGLIGAGALGGLVTKLADTADRLGKTSTRLGVTSDDLQKLRFAAKQSGVEVSTFDMALQRFTRRASEASEGTGVAVGAFEELGITLKNQDGTFKSNTDLLKEVADAIQATTNQSDRVRLSFKLFDSEGVKLVNMLQQGSGAIEGMGKQLESVSGIIDEKAIKASEQFNDRLSMMASATSGVLTGLVELVNKGLDPFFEEIEKTTEPIEEQHSAVQNQINALVKLRDTTQGVTKEVETYLGTTVVTIKTQEEHVAILQKQIDVLAPQRDELKKLVDAKQADEEATRKQIETAKKLKAEMEQLVNVTQDSTSIWHNYYQTRNSQLQDEATAFQESLQEKKQAESDYLDQRIIKNMEASQAHREMLRQESIDAELKAQADKQRTKDVAKSSLSTIQSLSAGVANESRGLFELNKAVSIANVIVNAAEASSKAMAQLGAYGPPVATAIYALAIANVAKIASQKFPEREYGGDVIANKPYIVGEAGPEVFTPGRTGTITPNNQLGKNSNITFNINAIDSQGIDQLLIRKRAMIIGMINEARNRNLRRSI